jgi:hypothetical protein
MVLMSAAARRILRIIRLRCLPSQQSNWGWSSKAVLNWPDALQTGAERLMDPPSSQGCYYPATCAWCNKSPNKHILPCLTPDPGGSVFFLVYLAWLQNISYPLTIWATLGTL